MSRDKAIYKCPVCDYFTHFPKALEAHQRHRKHFPKPEEPVEAVIIPEEPEVVVTAEEPAVVEKKARKPRKKAAKESEE